MEVLFFIITAINFNFNIIISIQFRNDFIRDYLIKTFYQTDFFLFQIHEY